MIAALAEPWGYDFMVRALVVAVLVSVVAAALSAWVVHIGWSLLGDAVSHAVVPGVAIAYLLGLPFALGALAFALGSVALIRGVGARSRIKEDAAIGVVFSTLFALGLVLISAFPSQVDLGHILFGNLLGIADGDLAQVAILAALAGAVIVWRRDRFTWFAFDRAHMASLGRSPRRESAVMLAVLAVTAVAALQAVGVILVVAALVTPGATAHLLANRMDRILLIAPALAAGAAVAGLYLAYYADVSPAGAIVLVHGLLFVLALVLGRHGLRARHGWAAGAAR